MIAVLAFRMLKIKKIAEAVRDMEGVPGSIVRAQKRASAIVIGGKRLIRRSMRVRFLSKPSVMIQSTQLDRCSILRRTLQ